MGSSSEHLQSEVLGWLHFFISAAPALLACVCLLNIAAGVVHSAVRTLMGYQPIPGFREKEMV